MSQDKQEILAVKKAGFAGYDKSLHSKCKKPDRYGIRRVPAAESALAAQAPKTPRKDVRKLKCRVSTRMANAEYALLQQAFLASCAKTMQDFTRKILVEAAKAAVEKEKPAPGAATPEADNSKKTNKSIADNTEDVNHGLA